MFIYVRVGEKELLFIYYILSYKNNNIGPKIYFKKYCKGTPNTFVKPSSHHLYCITLKQIPLHKYTGIYKQNYFFFILVKKKWA